MRIVVRLTFHDIQGVDLDDVRQAMCDIVDDLEAEVFQADAHEWTVEHPDPDFGADQVDSDLSEYWQERAREELAKGDT